jgi:hypothetical protein
MKRFVEGREVGSEGKHRGRVPAEIRDPRVAPNGRRLGTRLVLDRRLRPE